jgi:hypothetical protein
MNKSSSLPRYFSPVNRYSVATFDQNKSSTYGFVETRTEVQTHTEIESDEEGIHLIATLERELSPDEFRSIERDVSGMMQLRELESCTTDQRDLRPLGNIIVAMAKSGLLNKDNLRELLGKVAPQVFTEMPKKEANETNVDPNSVQGLLGEGGVYHLDCEESAVNNHLRIKAVAEGVEYLNRIRKITYEDPFSGVESVVDISLLSQANLTLC